VKSAAFRPLYKIFFWLFVVCAVLLGYMGSQPPEGIYVIAAGSSPSIIFSTFL